MAQNKKVKYVEPDATYVNTLTGQDKERYLDKIKVISVDPYTISDSSFVDDVETLPPLQNEDLVEYLVFRTSTYTMEQFKAVKGLGATNQLTSGWIAGVVTHKPVGSDYVIAKAKVPN